MLLAPVVIVASWIDNYLMKRFVQVSNSQVLVLWTELKMLKIVLLTLAVATTAVSARSSKDLFHAECDVKWWEMNELEEQF